MNERKSFLDDYPLLKKEWNWEKNNNEGIFPWNLSKGSGKKVGWNCKKNHGFSL